MKKVLAAVIVLFLVPLTVAAQDFCEGNFDCDQDVDGTDAAVFKEDFGRNAFSSPCDNCYTCPPCIVCEPCDACSCWHSPAPVPQTGQTTSYATGDDGNLEKGVAWPNPRFTDNDDGTVTDNLTGLIWLKNANCFGLRTWSNALSDSNGLADGQCGLTDSSQAGDWRLPNRFELESLLDLSYVSPAISNTAGTGKWSPGDPFSNVRTYYYWSSTTYTSISLDAWYVAISSGVINVTVKASDRYVWPVRDPL